HKPWQRGTNENTNDIIRFFFPKGFDFRSVTHEDIQFVESLINNRPRKCLGWNTPAEILDSCVALP
ncbi:MAG: IS30 family transposase, partial [Clostridia bacterium]|nr:IS30 family transposase [Clostridia bacterium]